MIGATFASNNGLVKVPYGLALGLPAAFLVLHGEIERRSRGFVAIFLPLVGLVGAIRGLILASYRVIRCNPFSHGGFDPVPDHFTLRGLGHIHPADYHGEAHS